MANRQIIKCKVENNPGVVNRILGLVARRGARVTSMAWSMDPGDQNLSLDFSTDLEGQDLKHLTQQVENLEEVLDLEVLWPLESLQRTGVLVRLAIEESRKEGLQNLVESYRAKIVHRSSKSLIYEVQGRPEKIEGFLEAVGEFSPLETQSYGISALNRKEKEPKND